MKPFAALLAFSVAVPVFAAEPWSFTVEPKAQYLFDADAGPLSLSIFRAGGVTDVTYQVSEGTKIGLRGEGEYARYDIDGVPGDDDFSTDLIRAELRPHASVFLSPSFGLFGGAYLAVGAEIGADFDNAFTYGGYFGANYQIVQGVWIGGGIGYITELEHSGKYYPLINAYWQITPELLLMADGLGGRLSYTIDNNWSIFLDGHYEFREYRLDDNGIIPGGALRETGVPLLLGVRYAIDDSLSLSLAGGAMLFRNVRLTDTDGDALIDESVNPGAIVAASFEWKF